MEYMHVGDRETDKVDYMYIYIQTNLFMNELQFSEVHIQELASD